MGAAIINAVDKEYGPRYSVVGFLPGIFGVAVLFRSGLSPRNCYLAISPISGKGFAVLAGVFVLSLSAILPFGEWTGSNWPRMFLYAPTGGISQELFFRAALLPALLLFLPGRPRSALFLHSLLFSIWHIGPLFKGTPVGAVAAIMFVPFLAGIGWGWQVRHDGTVVWAMIQHRLIWMVGSPLSFG